MFDLGWSELLVVGIVALIVVGPKDLPGLMRTVAQSLQTVRRMAGDFRRQFDDMVRDTELEDLRKQFNTIRNPQSVLIGPEGEAASVHPPEEGGSEADSTGGNSTKASDAPQSAITPPSSDPAKS